MFMVALQVISTVLLLTLATSHQTTTLMLRRESHNSHSGSFIRLHLSKMPPTKDSNTVTSQSTVRIGLVVPLKISRLSTFQATLATSHPLSLRICTEQALQKLPESQSTTSTTQVLSQNLTTSTRPHRVLSMARTNSGTLKTRHHLPSSRIKKTLESSTTLSSKALKLKKRVHGWTYQLLVMLGISRCTGHQSRTSSTGKIPFST